jgi:hypothetical protein
MVKQGTEERVSAQVNTNGDRFLLFTVLAAKLQYDVYEWREEKAS